LAWRWSCSSFFALKNDSGSRVSSRHVTSSEKKPSAACEVARFHERGADGDVFGRAIDAALHGAHAVADFEADVPECADQLLDLLLAGLGDSVVEQNQEVDVRPGIELAAAVAAGGDERSALEPGIAPHFADAAIDEGAVPAQ